MTLFFNFEVLQKSVGNDPEYLLEALRLFHKKKTIPKNSKSKYKPLKVDLSGLSFLLNPDDLFKDRSTDILYKVQYINLASRRNYLDYKIYNQKSLDLSYYPEIVVDWIKHNPLLTISNNKIYFKYEEST